MDKYSGKRLDGRYEIHELIGVGGMALVYRAYDTIDDRTVAIKILKDEFLHNQEFIRRFKNESKAIAVLSHPNIVKVFDVSFGDRIQYIVMEYIDGITLKDYLDQQKEVKWKEAIHFTLQILRALQHAHEKGIVHRDIKPQNIMLLQDGTIKVTDFGIARFARSETRTMTDKAIGSVHYIAPEQARGDLTDEKADIYSVGVMLYEMITGQLPFEADNAVSVAIMQLQADPKPPKEINPDIPDGLEEITLKAMQKNPAQRYQSSAEMLRDIEAFRRNPSISFQYKYFVDENPTKYIDAIDSVRGNEMTGYDDNYVYEEVPVDGPKKQKSKAVLATAGVMLAFLLIAIGMGVFALVRSMEAKPESTDILVVDFKGKMYDDVVENEEYTKDFHFVKETKTALDKEPGTIVEQNPKAGKSVKREEDGKATITLIVSVGADTVPVPKVDGYSQADAERTLRDADLVPYVELVASDTVEKGIVIRTDPANGEQVAKNDRVKILVSSGPAEAETVTIPSSLFGLNFDDAKGQLTAMGLVVGDPVEKDETKKPKGTVVDSTPLPGAKVAKGSTVILTISSGVLTIPVNVPLPSGVARDITLKAYLNGQTVAEATVNPKYNPNYQINVKGSGTGTLVVTLDGNDYRIFPVDFNNNKVDEPQVFPYIDKPDPTPSSKPPESEGGGNNNSSQQQGGDDE